MNKQEMMDEIAALRLQLESNQSPDWMQLMGCWNRQAAKLLMDWALEANAIHGTRMRNGTEPTPEQQRRFTIVANLIEHGEKIHAICESRQQQRNASLGLPPTEWQLCQMLCLTIPDRQDHGTKQRDISIEGQTAAPPAFVQQRQPNK